MNAPNRPFAADLPAERVSLEARRIRLYTLLLITDLLVLGASFYILQDIYIGRIDEMAALMAAAVVPVFGLLAFSRRLYSIGMLEKNAHRLRAAWHFACSYRAPSTYCSPF